MNIINYLNTRGYLTKIEREYLYTLATESDTIINVGVEFGASVHCFVEGSNPQTKILALDLIGADKFVGKLKCKVIYLAERYIAEQLLDLNDLILDSLNTYTQKTVVFVKGNSNTIPLDIKAEIIFLDGCHWGKCLQNDIAKYSRLATKYLLFHDYTESPIHRGVKEALDNWDCPDFQKITQVDSLAVYKRVAHTLT